MSAAEHRSSGRIQSIGFPLPGVRMQGSATALRLRGDDLEPVGGHQLHRGVIDLREENRHHAARDKAYTPTPLPLSRGEGPHMGTVGAFGEYREQLIQA